MSKDIRPIKIVLIIQCVLNIYYYYMYGYFNGSKGKVDNDCQIVNYSTSI